MHALSIFHGFHSRQEVYLSCFNYRNIKCLAIIIKQSLLNAHIFTHYIIAAYLNYKDLSIDSV